MREASLRRDATDALVSTQRCDRLFVQVRLHANEAYHCKIRWECSGRVATLLHVPGAGGWVERVERSMHCCVRRFGAQV